MEKGALALDTAGFASAGYDLESVIPDSLCLGFFTGKMNPVRLKFRNVFRSKKGFV